MSCNWRPQRKGSGIHEELFSLHKRVRLWIHFACYPFFLTIFLFGNRAISFSPLGYPRPPIIPKTYLPTQPTHTSFWSNFEPQWWPYPCREWGVPWAEPPPVMQSPQPSAEALSGSPGLQETPVVEILEIRRSQTLIRTLEPWIYDVSKWFIYFLN